MVAQSRPCWPSKWDFVRGALDDGAAAVAFLVVVESVPWELGRAPEAGGVATVALDRIRETDPVPVLRVRLNLG